MSFIAIPHEDASKAIKEALIAETALSQEKDVETFKLQRLRELFAMCEIAYLTNVEEVMLSAEDCYLLKKEA